MNFSVDWEDLWDNASEIFNNLFPIFAVPIGISLGLAVLGYIMKAIKGAIK